MSEPNCLDCGKPLSVNPCDKGGIHPPEPWPAPPSALSGVSAEELRELAESCDRLATLGSLMASNQSVARGHRAASILRALAESMEGGKG